MMPSVDPYLARRYDRRRYDCLHFAADVWRDTTGEDLRERLDGLLGAPADRHVTARHLHAFRRLASPAEPCLVLFQRPRTPPHIGVFLRGRVLHLREQGAVHQPLELAAHGFTSVRCFA